ncbi:hypothetical protein B0T13DRAFT_465197 [Neurospora crassa]|nr:hypothetical protein B0T13DRAFT_465197 [Neurospora crassa]
MENTNPPTELTLEPAGVSVSVSGSVILLFEIHVSALSSPFTFIWFSSSSFICLFVLFQSGSL